MHEMLTCVDSFCMKFCGVSKLKVEHLFSLFLNISFKEIGFMICQTTTNFLDTKLFRYTYQRGLIQFYFTEKHLYDAASAFCIIFLLKEMFISYVCFMLQICFRFA